MAFAIPLAMAATAVGAGVSMFGQYQAGQAQAAEYNYRQNVENQFANALDVRANALQAEGGVKQRMVGVSGAEAISAQNVFESAKNVSLTGPAASMIRASQIGKTQYEQGVALYDAAQAAYGERFQAAERRAGAGLYGMAAQEAPIAADYAMAGTGAKAIGGILSMGAAPGGPLAPSTAAATAIGESGSVNPKWYPGGSSWDYS